MANSHTPRGSLPLTSILFSERVRARVEALRALPYGSDAFNVAKRSMPCYTPSSVFCVRNSEGVVEHSGVLCIEWDKVEDEDAHKDLLGGLPFIYCVGLSCSRRGVFALVKIGNPTKHRAYFKALADYFDGIGYGVIITVLPLLFVGLFARLKLKINYYTLMGLLSGSMTNPPALGYSNSTAGNDMPAVAYATVYPVVMFLRVLIAQVLILTAL